MNLSTNGSTPDVSFALAKLLPMKTRGTRLAPPSERVARDRKKNTHTHTCGAPLFSCFRPPTFALLPTTVGAIFLDDGKVEYEAMFTAFFAVIFGAIGVGQVRSHCTACRAEGIRPRNGGVSPCATGRQEEEKGHRYVPNVCVRRCLCVDLCCVLVVGLQISSDAKDAGEGEQAAAKIFRLTDEPLNIDPLSDVGAKPVETKGAVEFKNIFFAYPSRPDMQVCW